MDYIDLRSDTVTKPTPEMLEAMANAQLGDDVFEEDPTVNRLQEMAAERMGKEAGLFVTSGTQGNLLAVMTHCNHGQAAIMGQAAHTALYEVGGVASVAGVFSHLVPNLSDGSLNMDAVFEILADQENVHHPDCGLLIVENTQNSTGGLVISTERMDAMAELAKANGIHSHVDGARIFNAAANLHVPAQKIVANYESVTFCLSKGLCAPVGSVLCGSKDFIHRARKFRKMLGGGMRQAGVLAAAGIVALESMVDRLAVDHTHARRLAQNLNKAGFNVENVNPPSNMVFLQMATTSEADDFCDFMRENKILVNRSGPKRLRMVTHYWIDDNAVVSTLDAAREWKLRREVNR